MILSQKTSHVVPKISDRVVKSPLKMPRGRFWRRIAWCMVRTFIILGTSDWFSSGLISDFHRKCFQPGKNVFYVSKGTFRTMIFCKNFFLEVLFCFLGGSFSENNLKFFGSFVKAAFLVSRGKVWKSFVQNIFYQFKIQFKFNFLSSSKLYSNFVRKILGQAVKVAFSCQEDYFENFLSKN